MSIQTKNTIDRTMGSDGVNGDTLLYDVSTTINEKIDNVESIAQAALVINKNFLRNPNFKVNQDNFAGGLLPQGQYGYDLWYGDSLGVNITQSGNLVTLSIGRVAQNIKSPGFAGKTVTLSAVNGTGDITGDIDGTSGLLPLTVSVDPGSTGNIKVAIHALSGPVSFEALKLEISPTATVYIEPEEDENLRSCQYFYWNSGTVEYHMSRVKTDSTTTTTEVSLTYQFPVSMASSPSVTVSGSVSPSVGGVTRDAVHITDSATTATLATVTSIIADARI